MASNRRARELARARTVRQQQRRALTLRRRRRNRVIALVAVLSLAALGGIGYAAANLSGSGKTPVHTAAASPSPRASATPSPTAAPRPVACGGRVPPAPRTEHFASPPMTINPHAGYAMTLHTSCGAIVVTLAAAKAPKTVNALAFLAAHHFYDDTPCHRLVISTGLTVLQCGDPTGTGTGGPGFTLPTENTAGAVYRRGVVAMANTGAPDSTGSQFFLVDKNSQLPPSYTVVGSITAGLPVLDRLVAVGTDNSNGPGDGHPRQRIYLYAVTVAKT